MTSPTNAAFIALLLTATFVITGCGSTEKPQLHDPVTNERYLTIASTEPYVWDENKSTAYNVALMAQPAGVGFGMADTNTPRNTDLGRSESSVLSATTGFFTGGLLGAAGNLAMDSGNDKRRDWNPSIVTFYDKTELDLKDPLLANKVVRVDVSNKIVKALKVDYPDTFLEGVFSYKNPKVSTTGVTVLSGGVCNAAVEYGKIEGSRYSEVAPSSERFKNLTKEDTSSLEGDCFIYYVSTVVGTIENKIAVVTEFGEYNPNIFIANAITSDIEDAFVIFPDMATYYVDGSKTKHQIPYPYPVVVSNGKEHLLDIDEVSSPSILF